MQSALSKNISGMFEDVLQSRLEVWKSISTFGISQRTKSDLKVAYFWEVGNLNVGSP